jgi:serine/threonine-protein kinase
VTCAEYLEFLNSISREEAFAYVPGEPGTSMPLWPVAGKKKFKLPEPGSGSAVPWSENLPVLGVNWNMANAYINWKSEKDGREYKLPSELEWEKAARGADGRFYPWGNRFEPTYCKNVLSREGEPSPEPVGTYPIDRSPSGVCDLAGGVREWLETPAGGAGMQIYLLRGGSWAQFASAARAASRFGDAATATSLMYGFRLATLHKATKKG